MALQPNIEIPDLDAAVAMSRGRPTRLTERSHAKLKAFQRQKQRAYDVFKPAYDRVRAAHHAFRTAEDNFDRIRVAFGRGQLSRTVEFTDANGTRGRRVEADTKGLQRAEAERDRAYRDWKDLEDEAAGLEAYWQALGGLVGALESWIRDLPRRARVVDYDGKAPALRKGETPADALMRAERDLQALAVRRSELQAAPIASGEIAHNIRKYVAELTIKGAPDPSHVLLSGDPADIRYTTEAAPTHSITPDGNQITGHARVVDPVALLAWANPDVLIARLEEEVQALAGDDADAITTEEREAGLAEVAEKMLTIEREAEFWTTQLEQSGTQALLRRDASPEAVLGVVIEGDSRHD